MKQQRGVIMKERIEFNMHSNYSRMNGVNSVKEIIDRMVELGMDTVAITDIGSVKALPQAYRYAKKNKIKLILGMEAFYRNGRIYCEVKNEDNYSRMIILVKNENGRKNLYKLISAYYKNGYAELKNREGLLIGTNGIHSDMIHQLVINKNEEEIIKTINFYDFILIDPMCYQEHNDQIVSLAQKTDTIIIASNSPYYLSDKDSIAREVLRYADGKDPEFAEDLCLYGTEDMLTAFDYLGDKAEDIVINNGHKLAELIGDNIPPIPPGTFRPDGDKAFEEVKNRVYTNAVSQYGCDLPETLKTRLDKEISFIGKYKENSLPFWIAMKLVDDSKSKGFPIVSRAYVGSSIISYLIGITHTNPLAPHYHCKHCYHTEFVKGYESGFDLPMKTCPHCGKDMIRDGHNIPYETMFGYGGDKEPYIDLNLCHEYRFQGMECATVLLGNCKKIWGGVSSSLPIKTSFELIDDYSNEMQMDLSNEEKHEIAQRCEGAFRRTCMNPAKLLFIPEGYEIEDFTPVEYIEDEEGDIAAVTHFSYHESLFDTLLSFDFLSFDTADLLKKLKEKTGVEPAENDIADNEQLLKAIKEKNTDMIHELSTEYIKKMIDTTKPEKFSDCVAISGLAHGTDAYLDNAEELFKSGTCDFSNVIAFREDIFLYLDKKRKEYAEKTGNEPPLSYLDCFKISEATRKGRAWRDLHEYEDSLKEIGVQDWYIESAKKIRYLFPKSHSVEYMIASFKLLWYKLNYPWEYFDAYNELYDDVIPTGITGLDALLERGIRKGDLNVIAARPAMGKSSFALQLAANIAKSGKRTCFFSLEMPEHMVKERLTKQGNAEVPLIIDDSSKITPKYICEKLEAEKAEVAVIDYFGLIFPNEKKEKRIEECADIAFELRKIAEELDVSILCMSQFSKPKNVKPKLNNLLHEIEQEANVVLFLHRDAYFYSEDNKREDRSDITDIIVAKNKYGSIGTIEATFDSDRWLFIENEL